MKHHIFAGLAAVLAAGALIGSAPQANAGCQYGGIAVSKCDGPIQPDGTWWINNCGFLAGRTRVTAVDASITRRTSF